MNFCTYRFLCEFAHGRKKCAKIYTRSKDVRENKSTQKKSKKKALILMICHYHLPSTFFFKCQLYPLRDTVILSFFSSVTSCMSSLLRGACGPSPIGEKYHHSHLVISCPSLGEQGGGSRAGASEIIGVIDD